MLSLRLPRARAFGARAVAPAPVREFDLALLWSVVVLLLFGMVMVYSASIALPDSARYQLSVQRFPLVGCDVDHRATNVGYALPVIIIVLSSSLTGYARPWQEFSVTY